MITPYDFHVTLMHSEWFRQLLSDLGFIEIITRPEPTETYNTFLICRKGKPKYNYEDVLKEGIYGR